MDAKNLNWQDVTEGQTEQRLRLAQEYLNKLSPEERDRARLEECQDEFTGRRYGHAKIRRGMAVKIGGGGRNRGSGYAYQVWLAWNF